MTPRIGVTKTEEIFEDFDIMLKTKEKIVDFGGVMKVVVLGGSGMLGRAVLAECQAFGWEVAGYDLPFLDITKMDGQEIEDADWVVNCAAYTQVDMAEEDPTKVFEVNGCGAGRVARMCRARGIKLLHVSTDYVFNGNIPSGAYDENDSTGPLNVYGQSKLLGELLVGREHPGALIVRTQSLFGDHGANFVKSILHQVESGKKVLKVVNDQVTCPTYVVHLARGMVKLMALDANGVVHVSSENECSWADFAFHILDETDNLFEIGLEDVKTGEFPVKAVRPKRSVLCKARYTILTDSEMPNWLDGLREYLDATRT